MQVFKRNILILAISQALMLSNMSLMLTVSALVGFELAPDKSLATLPIAVIFIAVMFTSIPAAMVMERFGRKAGFVFSTFFGIAGGMLATIAIFNNDFWLFTCSGVLVGMFNGFGNYYRFAAADSVEKDYKSRAISYVLLGGVAAAVIGPNLATYTRELIPDAYFAGSYAAVTILYLLMTVTLLFLKLPKSRTVTNKKDQEEKGRSLLVIALQPKFIVALLCAMLGYGVMSFVMTATPLAMQQHAHTFPDTSFVIQWHVLGMFAPSFITGTLIERYGVLKVMFVGGVLGLACVVTNLLGTSVSHYWVALTLLGVSWNFLFIGGTTLLTETYKPEESSKTQAMNDFIIFTTVTISSLTAGVLQHLYGWQMVNLGVIPLLVIILICIAWLTFRQRHEAKLVID